MAKAGIVPFLWYVSEAEEAARFYASVFPRSRVTRVTRLPVENHSGPPGSVSVVEFTLFGREFQAMSAGPHDPFNDAVSFMVPCDTQKEIDRYWDAILKNGGKPQACGWIIDRFGVRWQITPAKFAQWMGSRDKAAARRFSEEMMRQVKFDIAKLEDAFKGK